MRLIIFILFLFGSILAKGQDAVFSQFTNTTIMVNPAITGNYMGVVRTTLNQRMQWAGFGLPYNSTILTVDKSLRRKGSRRDRISYGAYFVRDGAFTVDRIEWTQVSASLGFHKQIWRKKKQYKFLGIGAQMGTASRKSAVDDFSFDSQITPNGIDQNIVSGENFFREAFSYPTLNIGLLLVHADSSLKRPVLSWKVGYGLFNAVPAKEAVTSINTQKLSPRQNFNAGAIFYFKGTKLFLKTDVLFTVQRNAHMMRTQVMLDYWYSRKYAFLAGFNLNVTRSWGPCVGVGFRNVNIIYSFDMRKSNFGTHSSSEITLIYLNPMPGREKLFALRAGDARL